MQQLPTYTTYDVRQVFPAQDWQVVYHAADGSHTTKPVYYMALTRPCVRYAATGIPVPETDDETWSIEALTYGPQETWGIARTEDTYCGLMPPNWSMDDFETLAECYPAPRSRGE